MHPVEPPRGGRLQRSVAACLAAIVELLKLPAGRLIAEEARRNIVTRGIDLNALVGEHFRVGDVECFG